MFLVYFFLWIIFLASFTVEIAVVGLIVTTVIFAFACKFMDYSIKKEIKIYMTAGKLIKYTGVLFWEIIQANLATIKMILSEEEVIEPVLAHFTVDLKTQTAKTLLANAISLTPGTITVNIDGNHYCVHCLDKSFAKGMDHSAFVKILSEIENVWSKD